MSDDFEVLYPKKKLTEWLDEVDYSYLNSNSYVPSSFALGFMNFIKLIELGSDSLNKTPPMHLSMLDKIGTEAKHIVNLCFRGAAKSTLLGQYMAFYLGFYRTMPGVGGDIMGMIYVSDTMDNGVKTFKESMEFRYNNSKFLQDWFPKAKFNEDRITLTNKEGKPFQIKMYGASTGIRGSQIFGHRPPIAILDDLVSDKVANSPTSMNMVKDTVYKGIKHALHPTNFKVIFNGTPFNREDIIVSAVESGGWEVNVWPVCEKFPVSKKDFKGAWEDRFPYESVMDSYRFAESNHQPASFYQELMLRISSVDDRLVQDHEIQWYKREALLANRGNFNYYITTDFATSEKQSADYSVISVWAYNNHGQWFWVDGFCGRVTLDKAIDSLFEFVTDYRPASVGVEITGQQGAFIDWIKTEMMNRNIFFSFARSSQNTDGIRPTTNKLSRFNLVVPLFKAGNIFFPQELKDSKPMVEFTEEIEMATDSGLKGKDDFLDTISMLSYMKAWKPTEQAPIQQDSSGIWNNSTVDQEINLLDSYVV